MPFSPSSPSPETPPSPARLRAWFGLPRRGVGGWAFLLHRLSGLVLVLYLGLHFYVLHSLTRGPAAYRAMLTLLNNPWLKALEVGLFATVAYHAFNGVRLVLMGLNIGVRHHKAMFWAAVVAAFLVTVAAAVAMFSAGGGA